MPRFSVAREGWPFILASAAGALFFLALSNVAGALLMVFATGFVTWFFRDPDRAVPEDDSLLVSPADGKVVEVSPQKDGGTRIGIFLSIFDVHVNRVPLSGKITGVNYRRGKFLAAWKALATEENEQNRVDIRHSRGTVGVVQVAGLIARRIICRIEPGGEVTKGQRYGLIRFGSRVDTYFPPGVRVEVAVGAKVKGGESVIGRWDQ